MRTGSRHKPRGNGGSFWTSYADMMAGLMLVFALIMIFSVYQFAALQETKRVELTEKENQLIAQQDAQALLKTELDEKSAEIEDAEALLQTQQTTLDEQEEQIAAANTTLADREAELAASNLELATNAQALADAQALIDAAQLSIAAQQQQLDDQSTQLAAQQALVDSQQTLMDAQQERIDALIGVRSQLIKSLGEELRKSNLDVTVDAQTGAIALKGAVLFDVGKSTLKEGGMSLLDSFIPVYVRTLLMGGYKEYVAEIIIEGHTDTDGPYLDNLKLSQDRAYAVAQYCLQDGFGGLNLEERELLRTIMTANGRSWGNPITYSDGSINKEASRRVEFKFRLKEAEMINEMRTIMESQQPTPAPVD